MNIAQILALIIPLIEQLEQQGVITIGGWDPSKVDAALSVMETFLKGVDRPNDGSPDNPGLGPLNKPAGSGN